MNESARDLAVPPTRSLTRRQLLEGAVALSGALMFPVGSALSADSEPTLPKAAKQAMEKSPLVYLSPIKSDGKESSCHAEIWFVHRGDTFYVVTPSSAWRTKAIGKGLDKARVWVGDHGGWRRNSKFRTAPSYLAKASIVPQGDPAIERSLAIYAGKYASDWGTWGPRFRRGLKDGSRVMLRYEPEPAGAETGS